MQHLKHIKTFLFLFLSILVLSQNEPNILYLKAKINFKNLGKSPEIAFKTAKNIEKEAEALSPKNENAFLLALQTQCSYFEKKYDFKNLLDTSQHLESEAKNSQNKVYVAIAKEFQFKAYIFSDLKDKALLQLDEGLSILNTIPDQKDSLVINTKSNLFISYSNYYITIDKPRERLKYIKLAIQEHQNFNDKNYKKKLQYIDYSNLATVYDQLNKDSAKYYAQQSLALDKDYQLNDIKYSNYIILGKISKEEKDYAQALAYLKQAEKLKNNRNHLNTQELYEIIISIYNKLGDVHNQQQYQIKLDSLKINIVENQNKSLHKIISDKEQKIDLDNWKWLYLVIPIAIALIIYLALHKRKSEIEEHRDVISFQEPNKSEEYSKLIEMFKKGDLAFITYFNDVFPDFSKKLLDINPKIIQSDIEFCALLKLNIPTKDIVRYWNIAHRTVQNKKYIIRKKLAIPKEIDIYQWFNDL
ncbi:hypothetical protein SAMN05421664_2952 [Chryseobacterium soldanellicola]|uniref:Tetratricopeptide repeat-containing protein n=1 Tax=Chryseobacterium soldanellicola TaxID=311333 RepID=A0A1H1FBI2_9FLAO|nr:hypothetical protein [Chryseobacterium soldanellicola]SDQ97806.1 hypothetical protein SAMN05421664_2952 [Chryseobacterium soldanellicola]